MPTNEVLTLEDAGFSSVFCQLAQRVYQNIAGEKHDVAGQCTRIARALISAAQEIDNHEVYDKPIHGDFVSLHEGESKRVFHTWVWSMSYCCIVDLAIRQFEPGLPMGPLAIPSNSPLFQRYLIDEYLTVGDESY